jgi:2,7-dihydroxy-5-methyl-1-naphthoate 7-O-methyltransferase
MDLWDLSDLATPWCVHVAATLRVADHLSSGPMPIAQLAAACGADADALSRVLRQLIGKGVFAEPELNCFALNDAARQFLDPGLRMGLDLDGFGGRMAPAWGTLLLAVRTGKCAYFDAFGRSFWEELDENPGIGAAFDDLMGPGHGTPDPEVLVDPADWASVRTVVDVGGGTGSLLAEVLRTRPGVRGVLVDLPRPVAFSARVFEAAGVADRATAAPQSFFDPLPAGADLYLLKNVLADWPDAEALALLKRCAEAARPGGRVVVLGGVTEADRPSPELLMLVLVGGRSRTVAEFRELARQAGLGIRATGRQRSQRFIVECGPL